MIEIKAQPGPQEMFLKCSADIAFYGGAAGGGKSFALLVEPIRHMENKDFGAVIFRKNTTMIRNEGGLWDESMKLYTLLDGHPRNQFLDWVFETGMSVKFSHLQHERTVFDWQGAQIPFIGFDELTHFSRKQFFYMLSRNRSTSGVPGYVRATCNPDADSWVRTFIDWYIDPITGYAIPDRSGVVRWFVQLDDVIHWGNTPEELIKRFPAAQPKSFTFISAKLQDNRILMEKDPAYLANLMAQGKVDRARLLDGNWNIRATAGNIFNEEWFEIVDVVPGGWSSCVRFWDRAATVPTPENPDPDWTRGLKMYSYPNGTYVVADLKSCRENPGRVETLIKNTAKHDGSRVRVGAQQDPGSAGKGEIQNFVKFLAGFQVETIVTTKDKLTRAKPVSAQAFHNNVKVLRAPWNAEFFKEIENFDGTEQNNTHDDIVDTLSGAFILLNGGVSILDAFRGT